MRPNSSVGWVRRADVEVSSVHYRVEVDRAARRIRVFDLDALVLDEPAAVGKPSTPTPAGQFFAVELLQPTNPYGAYGPYAFTLSAYSDVYQTFGSGDGAVGLHGTNESSSIGHDASHGCVRLHNDTIQRLAGMLPLGTPVYIR
jgi:lipoprotein-anchoring transpeptidase ErfK/SrfK